MARGKGGLGRGWDGMEWIALHACCEARDGAAVGTGTGVDSRVSEVGEESRGEDAASLGSLGGRDGR